MGAGRRAAKAIHEDLMKESDETLQPGVSKDESA